MLKNLYYTIMFLTTVSLISCCLSDGKGQNRDVSDRDSALQSVDSVYISLKDSLIFESILAWAVEMNLAENDLSAIIIDIAEKFEGSPYVAHTLESTGPEKLVINLREFDCTTFVENVLALSICIKKQNFDTVSFFKTLRSIRYRGGIIDGYPSRLHYFSEWLQDNQGKGFVDLVSDGFGDEAFDSNVDFMSQHADKYPELKDNPSFVKQISDTEKKITQYKLKCLSGMRIDEKSDSIHDGDIIAFCSQIEGLDISHVALACYTGNSLHFIHASTVGNKVELSKSTLEAYVKDRKNIYGILVARPKVN